MQKRLISFTVILLLLGTCYGLLKPQPFKRYSKNIQQANQDIENPEQFKSGESQTKYSVGYFTQVVDHFNYGFGSDATLQWNMRYLYNDTYWGGKSRLSNYYKTKDL